MSLVLCVDGERWRQHLLETVTALPGVVPVAKGNGYGFGIGRLARRCGWLDEQASVTGSRIDMMAVGTYLELHEAAPRFDGDLLVLTPWRPLGAALDVPETLNPRVIHTVSRLADVGDLLGRAPDARFVLEQLTSMRRHGMTRRDLLAAAEVLAESGLSGLAGVAMHLPLNTASHLGEVTRLINDVVATGLPTRTIFVSHLTPVELAGLRTAYPDFTIRPRIGTDLWLGQRAALKVTATVLDVHAIERGETFGYRGRSMPKGGHILVVSGGTAHGIGLEAPTGDQSLRSRAATIARSGMDVAGFVRSPFSIDGKQRLFAEPPHMQASMLFVPSGARVPDVGEDIEVRVRFTATTFDRVDIR
ncbi:alanine racemase [Nocardioides allogilvus]|uniref:alanine racemase n=1 Tax=Nocardioides allogilvus TaxID=2072017 RepID=UPI000D2FCE44|nr:alanine racemase [Nocardioides allogilvus]